MYYAYLQFRVCYYMYLIACPCTCMQVNNNGVISFQRAVTRFTSIPFPLNDDVLTEDLELIAPYWADVDTRGAGTVWYRETDNLELRTRAAGDIRTAFNQSTFLPMQLFIATWERVGYFSQHTDLVSTAPIKL